MTVVLFLGGPQHGKWHPVAEHCNSVDVRSTYRDKRITMPPSPLCPCLELEEIQSLTGNTCHRDPGRPIAEDREIEAILTRTYRRERFILQQDVHSVFVCDGHEFKEFSLGMIVALFRTCPTP